MVLLNIIGSIAESFTNNLITEDRYRMILDGLQVTLLITFCAAIFGTLLGGLVCWMRMSRRKWVSTTAKVYIDIMRGTPVLVLLNADVLCGDGTGERHRHRGGHRHLRHEHGGLRQRDAAHRH